MKAEKFIYAIKSIRNDRFGKNVGYEYVESDGDDLQEFAEDSARRFHATTVEVYLTDASHYFCDSDWQGTLQLVGKGFEPYDDEHPDCYVDFYDYRGFGKLTDNHVRFE